MSLFTSKSHFCMMRLISLFLPVRIDTFSHTLVDSSRSIFTFRGPYVCPFMVMGEFILSNFQGVTLPCTFTRYTLVKLATGFSRRRLSVLSLVTSSSPSELKSSLPTVMRCPQWEKEEGSSSQTVLRFWGSRCVQMQPRGLLIIHNLVTGFCICRPAGVNAFRLAYTGTSIFSKTRLPSTRTRPSWMNSSASRREHSALRLIHLDSRTISTCYGVVTSSPKACIPLHKSFMATIIIGWLTSQQN